MKALSKILNYPFYYSDSPNKSRVLRDFLEGRIRIVVATSSLSLGIDVPNIRAIFYIEVPYTLYDYAQETGRAGRDRKPSEALLLLPPSTNTELGRRKSSSEIIEKDIIQRYISDKCRRATLASYLDRKEEGNCSSTVSPCDICSPIDPSKISIKNNRFF